MNFDLVNDDAKTRRTIGQDEAESLVLKSLGGRGLDFLNELVEGGRPGIQVDGGYLVREGAR